MSAPHDVPDAGALVEAVRGFLADELLPDLEGRQRYLTRVCVHVLEIVERELELGEQHEQAHRQRLEQLGFTSDAELAAAIRDGDVDGFDPEVFAAVRQTVRDKLAVANPSHLDD